MDIEVVKVNPDTNSVDDDYNKNTKTRVWLETGAYIKNDDLPPMGYSHFYHDYYLDCGGDTFEEAIIRLAELVLKYYRKDRVRSIMEDEVSSVLWKRVDTT